MKIYRYKGEIIYCFILLVGGFLILTIIGCSILSLDLDIAKILFIFSMGLVFLIVISIFIGVICYIIFLYSRDKYYILEKGGITYYSKNEPIIFIDIKDIVAVHYSPWWHMLIGGLGFTTGAFCIKVINQVYESKTFKCFSMFNKNDGSALISFYCLKKTREIIAKILDLYLL